MYDRPRTAGGSWRNLGGGIMLKPRKNIGQELFGKCITLLQQRLNIKINHAVLLIDSDFGVHSFRLNDKLVENLILQEKVFHQDMIQLATKGQVSGGIVTCPDCLGAGEGIRNGILTNCARCRGGGQVVLMLNKTEINNENNGRENEADTGTPQ